IQLHVEKTKSCLCGAQLQLKAGLGATLSKNLERLDPRARTGNKRGLSEPPQGASSAAPVRVRGAAELFRKGSAQVCPALKRRAHAGSSSHLHPCQGEGGT